MEELVALAGTERGDSEMRGRVALDLRTANRRLFVAVVEERVVGYGRVAYFDPPHDAPADVAPAGYYLSGLLVPLPWRGLGVGQRLTMVRLAWIFERADYAWYFTNARNQASLALHAKLGFTEVTREFSYPGVTFDGGIGVLAKAAASDFERLEQGDR